MTTQFGSGFRFISTVLNVELDLPIDVTPNIKLDKPDKDQLEIIRNTLEKASGLSFLSPTRYYENSFSFDCDGATTRIIESPLSDNETRYYVLNFNQNNYQRHISNELHELLYVADFIDPYLASFFHWYTEEEYGKGKIVGSGIDPYGMQAFYELPHPEQPKVFNEDSIRSLKDAIAAYNSLDRTKHEGIIRAIEYNFNLKRLSAFNNLPVLGLFMIIEMLITHNPNDKEIGELSNASDKNKDSTSFVSAL